MVQQMFRQAERAKDDPQQLREIVEACCAALTLHTEIEEQHFYPVMRESGKDTDMIAEAYVEHASAKQLIAELEGGDAEDEEYAARFKVLGEYVKHHIKEEENEIFPQARRTRADFEPLLEALVARDEAVLAEGEQEGDSASMSSAQSRRGAASAGGGRKRAGGSQTRADRGGDGGSQSTSGSSTRGRRGRGGSESAGQSQSADSLGGSEADMGTSGAESGGETSRRGRRGSQEESADTDSGMRGRDAESEEQDTRGSRQGNR